MNNLIKKSNLFAIFCLALVLLVSCSSSKDKMKFIPVKSNGQWGYINRSGKFVIEPQFNYACVFHEGLAVVCQGDRFGYINEKGAFVINPQYEYADRFYDGIAVVRTHDGLVGFINKRGEYILDPVDLQDYSHFYEGLAIISPYNDYPYCINTNGEVVHKFDGFVEVLPYKDGKAIAIREDNSSVVFDKDGDVIGKTPYRITRPFSEGYAAFNEKGNQQGALDGSNGFLDEKMNVVVSPIYDEVHDYVGNVAVVEKQSLELDDYIIVGESCGAINAQFGLIDKNGNVLVDLKYKNICDFSDGLAAISTEDGFGYIDTDGHFVINPQFDFATNFSENLAIVVVDSKCGFIDKNGKTVISPQFDYASSFNNGLSIVAKSNKLGIINTKGEYVVPPTLDDVDPEVVGYKTDDKYDAVRSYYDTNRNICDDFISMVFHGNSLFDFEHYKLGDYAVMDGCDVESQHQVSVFDERSKVLHVGYFGKPIYDVEYNYWGGRSVNYHYDYGAGVSKTTFGYQFWDKNFDTDNMSFTCYSLLKLIIDKLQKEHNVVFENIGNGMYVCFDKKSRKGIGLQVEDEGKVYGPINVVLINDIDVFNRFKSEIINS